MIECQLFFDIQTSPVELTYALCELPHAFVPYRFTATENRTSQQNNVQNKKLFEAFAANNPLGFLLYTEGSEADRCGKSGYDVSLNKRDGLLKLTFFDGDEAIRKNEFDSLFSLARRFDLKFGFCCDESEYLHRNRLFYKLVASSIEAWIGRSLFNTLPGIYWKTLITEQTANDYGVNLDLLREACLEHAQKEESVHLFTFFEDAALWKENSAEIDVLCHSARGIYSRLDLDRELSPGLNRADFEQIFAKYR